VSNSGPRRSEARLDQLTAEFKKSRARWLLSEGSGAARRGRANLAQWDAASDGEYTTSCAAWPFAPRCSWRYRALLGGSELWRRPPPLRRDPRRRPGVAPRAPHRVTAAVTIAIVFSLVSEIGSLATFAGSSPPDSRSRCERDPVGRPYFFLIGR